MHIPSFPVSSTEQRHKSNKFTEKAPGIQESLDEFRNSLGRAENIPNPSQEQHHVGGDSLETFQTKFQDGSTCSERPRKSRCARGGGRRFVGFFFPTSHSSLPLHEISEFQGEALGEAFHSISNRELFQGFVSPKIPTGGEKFPEFLILISHGMGPKKAWINFLLNPGITRATPTSQSLLQDHPKIPKDLIKIIH